MLPLFNPIQNRFLYAEDITALCGSTQSIFVKRGISTAYRTTHSLAVLFFFLIYKSCFVLRIYYTIKSMKNKPKQPKKGAFTLHFFT